MQADAGIADAKPVMGGEQLVRTTLKSARTNKYDVVAGIKVACDPQELVEWLTMMVANRRRAK
ncbi:MAG: hypothetical protein MUE59_15020 [Thiobacillaceae bacterium]|jgi:hypothetical protein|nr:hypothetical protein [Thiobacillaceae bacterium]